MTEYRYLTVIVQEPMRAEALNERGKQGLELMSIIPLYNGLTPIFHYTFKVERDIQETLEKLERENASQRRAILGLRPIGDLELSVRTFNVLSNYGIRTLGDLEKVREIDLLRLKGFGRKSLNELKEYMENAGLAFADYAVVDDP